MAALTTSALSDLPFESLGPTKALLKRFFFAQEWGPSDDEALADAVGPGDGRWQERLDDDLVLNFGWVGGRFRVRIAGDVSTAERSKRSDTDALAATFEGDIVPEATPNPRTLVFRTGPVSDAASREYRSASEIGDHRVVRLFEVLPELVSVLVARDFVALSLRHPDRWPELLAPALAAVNEEFSTAAAVPSAPTVPGMAEMHAGAPAPAARDRRDTRLDRAWRELGDLQASDPEDQERDAAPRQVAAALLVELRPLLETALSDADAWVRGKALRGLAELGGEPSRLVIEPLAEDPDFRVRLEAVAVLRR